MANDREKYALTILSFGDLIRMDNVYGSYCDCQTVRQSDFSIKCLFPDYLSIKCLFIPLSNLILICLNPILRSFQWIAANHQHIRVIIRFRFNHQFLIGFDVVNGNVLNIDVPDVGANKKADGIIGIFEILKNIRTFLQFLK
jgi:hypothetical protein